MLACASSEAWLEAAAADWPLLLLDHAACEKKAASSALALIFAYPEQSADNLALARLAREELRHFEQVTRMMDRLGVGFRRLTPGRYAGGLRRGIAGHEPQRRIDLLLVNALIEARSCERFRLLAPRLPAPLGDLYADLERSEARHGNLYRDMAAAAASAADWTPERLAARQQALAAIEAALISEPDTELRFHSGTPAAI